MDWVIVGGGLWLLVYEALAGLSQLFGWRRRLTTLSEWMWRLFRRRPWTRWLTLGILVFLIFHLVFRGLSYGVVVGAPGHVGEADPCPTEEAAQ